MYIYKNRYEFREFVNLITNQFLFRFSNYTSFVVFLILMLSKIQKQVTKNLVCQHWSTGFKLSKTLTNISILVIFLFCKIIVIVFLGQTGSLLKSIGKF